MRGFLERFLVRVPFLGFRTQNGKNRIRLNNINENKNKVIAVVAPPSNNISGTMTCKQKGSKTIVKQTISFAKAILISGRRAHS